MLQNAAIGKEPAFRLGALFALVFASTVAYPAWAGRPLTTEDAGVLGPGECEVESFAGRIRNGESVNTRWAQLGCGVAGESQIAFGAGTEISGGDRTGTATLAGKTFLRELTDEQPGLALAYALFGARESGSSFKHDATALNAVVSIPYSGWLFHANLGGHYSQSSRNHSATWGLAAERTGDAWPIDLMTEAFGDDRATPWVQVAVRWTAIPKRLYLDASWGVQTDSARSKQITVGLKVVP